MNDTQQLQRRLGSGWNTWNVRSLLSHVWLGDTPADDEPASLELRGGFAVNLALWSNSDGAYLREVLAGREDVRLGAHSTDGSYTDVTLRWKGIELRVESGHDGLDLVMLVTCGSNQLKPCPLVIEGGVIWNRPGCVQRMGDTLVGHVGDDTVTVHTTAPVLEDPNIPAQASYLVVSLAEPVGISTGRKRTISEIHAAIITRRAEHQRRRANHGRQADVYEAVQSCVAWNTIFDPTKSRVISPDSRLRSVNQGGFALDGPDPFFAALLAATDSKYLAYANLLAPFDHFVWERDALPSSASTAPAVREKRTGFVPGLANAHGLVTRDRSQPPIASFVAWALYRQNGDKWLLLEIFEKLLAWNRWLSEKRDVGNLLAWGSNPYAPLLGNLIETHGVGLAEGARLESNTSQSPQYDGARFDDIQHTFKVGDVGLTSLYILDTDTLAEIAKSLGRYEERELRERADRYRASFARFWNDDDGLYYNLRTDSEEHDKRTTPSNFYPLIARIPTDQQAERMIGDHLCAPDQFAGEWLIPSLSRNDPSVNPSLAYRGAIQGTQNLLVYLGLLNYDLPKVRKELASRSEALLLKDWRSSRHIHESYNAETGQGTDGDVFTHRGALLGLIALMEAG